MTSEPPRKDRRRAERLPRSGGVRVSWAEGILQAYYANLSKTGAFVETTNLPPLGTAVRLDFSISVAGRQRGVRAESRVVFHSTPDEAVARGVLPGFGAEFQELVVGEEALFEFIEESLSNARAPNPDAAKARRRHPRTPVAFPTRWGTGPQLGRDGYLRNLSISGAFLEARETEPTGTHLYLWFELPTEGVGQTVKATAVVAYTSRKGEDEAPGMGIAFEVSTGNTEILERFIEAHLGDTDD